MILVDGITRTLFSTRYARPSELLAMSYRELLYFHNVLLDEAKSRKVSDG